jgi:putative membrane protein
MLLRHVIGAVLACAAGAALHAADSSGSAGGTATTQSSLAQEDLAFIQKATASGMFEVESARLALTRQLSEDQRRVAQKILDDHSRANTELRTLASEKGITLASGLDERYGAKIAALRQLQGDDFQKSFHEAQIEAHKDAIRDFRTAATDAKDPELRAWAIKTLPTLEQHQMHLKAHDDQHGAQSGMEAGDSGMSGERTLY